jgi:hypothetical protein
MRSRPLPGGRPSVNREASGEKSAGLECPVLSRNGAPEEIRTPDPQIRSLVLYPAELRARFSLVHWALGSPDASEQGPDGRERAL